MINSKYMFVIYFIAYCKKSCVCILYKELLSIIWAVHFEKERLLFASSWPCWDIKRVVAGSKLMLDVTVGFKGGLLFASGTLLFKGRCLSRFDCIGFNQLFKTQHHPVNEMLWCWQGYWIIGKSPSAIIHFQDTFSSFNISHIRIF